MREPAEIAGALLQVRGLTTTFKTRAGEVKAVDSVDLTVRRGEVVALVGESGCGKSVTALSILRLIRAPAGRIAGGQILFDGADLLGLDEEDIRRIRGDRIAMIFQDPMTALNPVFTIGAQIAEAFRLHRPIGRREAWDRAVDLLARVRIPNPKQRAHEYPHRLSGGMRQRVMIAIALACNPDLLIADEPTTALDVTIQAQILDLLREVQADSGMGLLMITHDLGVVAEIADRVAVMYAGRVVEEASVDVLFDHPQHPYTRGLLAGARIDAAPGEPLPEIPGAVPSLLDMPAGCAFAARCSVARPRCQMEAPALVTTADDRRVACFAAPIVAVRAERVA